MDFYIKDNTVSNTPVKLFTSTDTAISYMKGMVERKFGMNFEQYLTHLADLGHFGYDEREFYESLRDTFESGVVRSDKLIQCNILEATISKEGSN
jgi:hypothetical protein